MQFRFRRLRHTLSAFCRINLDAFHPTYGAAASILTNRRSVVSWCTATNIHGRQWLGRYQRLRYSSEIETKRGTASMDDLFPFYSSEPETKRGIVSTDDILSFIRSSLNKPRGSSYCWVNTIGDKNTFKEDGVFLVIIDEYPDHSLEASQSSVRLYEKAKALQQRYPSLQVLALQFGKSMCLNEIPTRMLQRIVKEYYVFPILLSRRIFEVAIVPCHIISKGLQLPTVLSGVDVDLTVLDKVIRGWKAEDGKESNVEVSKSSWLRPSEAIKEPDICSALRNLLFSFPGGLSVDEGGDRIFLSDINHHRIVVFNGDGKILDAIGSSPGFEDGEFEIAKLMRPAASFYDVSEDCLYFVDSENHAIRRADMERRIVETIFPVPDDDKKNKSFWKWVMNKIWTKSSTKSKSEELTCDSFLFPWHILKPSNNELFVLNQSFGTLWIINLESGNIREVIQESSKILEICGQSILEKCTPLSHLPSDLIKQQANTYSSIEGVPYAGLMSSIAVFRDDLLFCNTVGQTVVKFDKQTGSASYLQFSNLGILGLPYWLGPSSPEHLYAVNNISGAEIDHSERFHLLPGRVDIELNVNIPRDTDLVEPPQEGSIWRLARGSAADVSEVEIKAASIKKVGLAQQWYDELDNLTFSFSQDEELSTEEANRSLVEELPGGRVRLRSTVNTSPGTGEAIIYAALYLRLKKTNKIDTQSEKAARIANILDPQGKSCKKELIKTMMMMSGRELGEVIFVRPVHVRIQFETPDRPKAKKSRRELLTDSSIKVNVTL